MKSRGIGFMVLLVLSLLHLRADAQGTEYLNEVNAHLQDGRFNKAIKTLDEVIKTYPNDQTAITERANLQLTMLKFKEARKDIDRALALDDQNPKALLCKARLLYSENLGDSALHYADMGLSFDPDWDTYESLHSLKGLVQMSMDRYEDAEESLIKASKSPEVSLETMQNLATVLMENDKLDEAVLILKETVNIFDDHLESYINTGYLCNQLGMYDEAIDYLQRSLKMEPDNPYALANLALAHLQVGQLDKAYRSIEQSIKNENGNSFAYRVKGECLMNMGENDRACKEFKKAIQMGYTVQHEHTDITKLMITSCNAE
jgi:tetratricopeptide (TPR) repeat protein